MLGYSKFTGDFIVYKCTLESFLKQTTVMKPKVHYMSLDSDKDTCCDTVPQIG